MSFPVILKTSPHRRAAARIYYEVAANGVFQVRETESYRAVTRVESGIPGLFPTEEELDIRFPRVPAALLEEVLAFLDEAYQRYEAEAIAILFYRADSREYTVGVPEQRIPGYRDYTGRWRSYLHLRYGDAARPDGFVRFGSIHSHADLAAYSSPTDCHDERFEDGLHVVYGHLHCPDPSRAVSFVANGTRFRLDPEDVLEACPRGRRVARADWMRRLSLEEIAPAEWWSRSAGGWR